MNQEQKTEESAAEDGVCVKYRLVGEVQNVGFRQFLAAKAEESGVRGWAKNESDGSLIVLLEGGGAAVSQVAAHMREGPVGASVCNTAELLVEEDDAAPENFEIR